MTSFNIAGHVIGPDHPVFVIAEAGVNHDGEFSKAQALIEAAVEAGADCVKFQTFRADRLVVPGAPKADYQINATGDRESQLDMLRHLELPEDALPELMEYCRERGIVFLSTPYSYEDVDLLDSLDVPAFKLASLHMAEPAFLTYVAEKGRPIIVSTGMASLAEIDAGVQAIRSTGNEHFALLQCTTNYPADPAEANLRALVTLAEAFCVPTGYSDHTPGEVACIAAVALGARVIEKHMTLDRKAPGPDHAASLEPHEMEHLITAIRKAEAALGDGIKSPTPGELTNRFAMRRSLVAAEKIQAGARLTAGMLRFMRPGNGIPVADLVRVLDARVNEDIAAGEALSWSVLRFDD